MSEFVKVKLIDNYSNRYLIFKVRRDVWLYAVESEPWSWMSDAQRRKAESFFGKINAYHCKIEEV